VLVGQTNISAPVFAELLKEGVGAAGEIEHHGSGQLSTPEPAPKMAPRQAKTRYRRFQFRVASFRQ
jgi:hypothetical protein